MNTAEADSEWREGWRIALACAIGNGTGVALLFLTFSIFLLPMAAELKLSRGELGTVQALIITAALGAPLVGRLVDLRGFGWTFTTFTLLMGLVQLSMALWVNSLWSLALGVALVGLVGGGNSVVSLTRPVNAHFRKWQGLALGLVGAGVSLTMLVVPPLLHLVIEGGGWRGGLMMLAAISVVIGLPAVLLLMPRHASIMRATYRAAPAPGGGRAFLKSGNFWLLVLANMLISIATSGTISQLAPMIQDEGLGAGTAALGLSAFAFGQLAGKLGGGLLLDRFEPRRVAALLTVLPAAGFAMFLAGDTPAWQALTGAALIGLLQGADIGIFAWFVARCFGMERYGTVYGTLAGTGWIATAIGIIGFGFGYDRLGSYGAAQAVSIALLVLGALAILPVRLPRPEGGAG